MARRPKAACKPKKARVRGVFVEHVRRDELLKRWDGCCGICGRKVNPKSFEVDHIIPASKGGHHAYWNCQPAHPICNRLKGDLLPEHVGLILHLIDSGKRRKDRYRRHVGNRKRPIKPSSQPPAY